MNAARLTCFAQASGPLWRRLTLTFLLSFLVPTLGQAANTLSAWGNNSDLQCQPPPGLANVAAVAAGNLHSLALKSDGTVSGWGFNVFGQATPPPGLTSVAAISAGNSYSLALKSNSTVVQWGSLVAPPAGLTNVTAIAAGWSHALALKQNGTVVSWGTTNLPPAGLSNVVAIAAGNGQSLALLRDHTVVAWGDNSFGKTNVPPGLTNVAAIAAGKDHCLALNWGGTVVAWGSNSNGQTNPPVGLTNVVGIVAGGLHSLALKADGTLAAWGDNTYGQAVVNPATTGFIAIAAGGSHSLALRNDGSPVVLQPPLSQTVMIGKSGSFQVLATGNQPIAFRWQHNGTNLPGATNSVLMLTNIQATDGGAYTVVVSNFLNSVTSAEATLNAVGTPPFFTFQPQDTTNFCGDNASFQATVDGSPPFSYQWQFEGTPIDSAINNSAITPLLLLTNISADNGGAYSIVASNAFGSTTSMVAVLTVEITQPTITSSLTKTGKQGRALTYFITALHSPTSYAAGGLPPGLTIDPVSGIISGTPLETGTFGPTITAINNCSSDTEVLLITISTSVPVITSALTAAGTEQAPFSYQIRASDTPTGFTAQGLPVGLSVDPATGIISGAATYPGDFYATISATNAWGTGSATLHFTFANATISGLSMTNIAATYGSPYLLDFVFSLRDNSDPSLGQTVAADPRFLSAVAMENDVPVSPTETGVTIQRATSKLFKSFVILDFTESVASLSNGDANNDGISDAIDAMVAGAQDFVNQQQPGNQVGIYEFHREDMNPSNVVALTTDKALLNSAIAGIWTNQVQGFPAGSRAWDALVTAITNMGPAKPDEQHYVVLMSDGRDESSLSTTNDVVAAAQARGVNVFCIGFGAELDATSLQAITSATGGRYYDSTSLGGLTAAFNQTVKDLNGQYLLRWATLKRSSTPFIPSFQISYQGQTASSPPPDVVTNIVAGPPAVTNVVTNYFFAPYVPTAHAGNVTVGSLRLSPNTFVQPETVTLRAGYVPRYIRQILLHYRANWPVTPSIQSTNIGEILNGWSLTETNDGAGGKWLQLVSSNPANLGTSIPFASLGNLIQFSFRDMTNPSNAFSLFSVDNTIYATTGGQSFLMDTNTPSFITNYPALPFGTPIPWLISHGSSPAGPSNVWAAAELADPDHDGVPTWLEFLANTDPTNAASKFVVRTVSQSSLDGRYQVTFSTSVNRIYRLESSTDLATWTVALANVAGTGADVTIVDTRYLPGTQIFYRVAVY